MTLDTILKKKITDELEKSGETSFIKLEDENMKYEIKSSRITLFINEKSFASKVHEVLQRLNYFSGILLSYHGRYAIVLKCSQMVYLLEISYTDFSVEDENVYTLKLKCFSTMKAFISFFSYEEVIGDTEIPMQHILAEVSGNNMSVYKGNPLKRSRESNLIEDEEILKSRKQAKCSMNLGESKKRISGSIYCELVMKKTIKQMGIGTICTSILKRFTKWNVKVLERIMSYLPQSLVNNADLEYHNVMYGGVNLN